LPFFDAGDAAIYYEFAGEGKPLILLHGYALNCLMWHYQIPEFARTRQVVSIDLRGFGKSSCGQRWSGQVMADDVAGLLNELDLRDCAVIGFSMGGPVAIRLAIEQTDRIKMLILASSPLPSAGRARSKVELKVQARELETLTLHGVDSWAEEIGLKAGPLVDNIFRRNPEARPIWDSMIARHNPDYLRCMMTARANAASKVDWRARLPEITCPTLVIAGAQDARFIDASRYLHRHIAGSKLQIINGAGHMVNLEKPDEFNEAVLEFLR
jgi:pimeloyl-ACP methyl ester carboxylesterase